jgi:endonuclease G
MLSVILAAAVAAAAQACPQFFAGGVPPRPSAPVAEICFDGYALGHNAAVRTPSWSAEHLTAAGVAAAMRAKRAGAFHPERLLPRADRSELRDYRCAPFDRGHMTPVGDFGDPGQEGDTFSLANMIPQVPELNEGRWAGVEGAVRELAQRDGEIYVVTGPGFGSTPGRINGRVAIPSSVWKAIYDPAGGWAGAYVAPNDASGRWRVASIAALAALIGFDPMPGLPETVKASAGPLPAPLKGNSALKPRSCH